MRGLRAAFAQDPGDEMVGERGFEPPTPCSRSSSRLLPQTIEKYRFASPLKPSAPVELYGTISICEALMSAKSTVVSSFCLTPLAPSRKMEVHSSSHILEMFVPVHCITGIYKSLERIWPAR